MEIVIMYFLMWGVEIDTGERGDAVKHVSEYQSLSLAVNNDSTAALCLPLKPRWSLRESCQGNSEWNKSIVSCQKVEGDLGEARQETKYADLLSFVYTYWIVMSGKGTGTFLRQNILTVFILVQAFFFHARASRKGIQNCNEKQFLGTFHKAINWRCNYFCFPQNTNTEEMWETFVTAKQKRQPTFNLTGNQQQ